MVALRKTELLLFGPISSVEFRGILCRLLALLGRGSRMLPSLLDVKFTSWRTSTSNWKGTCEIKNTKPEILTNDDGCT